MFIFNVLVLPFSSCRSELVHYDAMSYLAVCAIYFELCSNDMLLYSAATLRTVYKKYGHTQYGRVSLKGAPTELLEQTSTADP